MNVFRMVVGIALLFTAIISGKANTQIINTVAGNGIAGYSGDGGPARHNFALKDYPCISVYSYGHLLFQVGLTYPSSQEDLFEEG